MSDQDDSARRQDSFEERISRSSTEADVDSFPLDLIYDKYDEGETEKDDDHHDQSRFLNGRLQSNHDIETVYVVKLDPDAKMRKKEHVSEQNLHDSPDQDFQEEVHKPMKCHALLRCCHSCCKPCMTEFNPLPPNPTHRDLVKYAFLCPVHGKVAKILTISVTLVFFYAVVWALTTKEALPGGNFFALMVLFVCCLLGGALAEKIRLPPLLGMLIVGCLLRNVPYINVGKDLDPAWSSALRNIALVVILTRAGLGLDPQALRKLSGGVFRLAFIPCLVEATTAAVSSHLLLGFPWAWGFMLGFVLAAVSPAVVVPSMLALQDKGYGVDKGIPTLIIAAASVDDVLAISGFGVVLGIAFSTGGIALSIIKGPLEAIAGVAYGIFFGVLTWYLPHKRYENKTFYRFMLLFCGGLFAVFGSRNADIAGAGALGCLTMAFVSALRWRKDCVDGHESTVSGIMASLWVVFQPLLFGLIGAEIDVSTIHPQTIGLGVAVLFIGLLLRMIASFLAVFGLGFTWKEQFFIPLAWLPKATVQAAIGSVALDTARAKHASDDQINLGIQLLTIAVLVILITAPIGAAAIALSAPRLLSRASDPPAVDHISSSEPVNDTTASATSV